MPADQGPDDSALAKALADLSWDRLVGAVRERCTGPLRERLEELPIASSYEEARVALVEAAEAYALFERNDPLPLDGIREVGRSLDRLERQGSLDGPELRAIASTLGAARALRRYLGRQRELAPALHLACGTDPTLDDLQEELLRAVEPDGTLADSASPTLKKLRTEVANLRARIVARLEQMLLAHADIVQDRFHTLREGRYVIPIRTDAHERLPGIVHGTSGSGASIFVEPRAIVSQGNRLKMAQGELEREEARILGILAGRVRDRLPEVQAAVDALDRADLRHAAARLAKDLRAVIPALERAPVLVLQAARHPLLALDGVDVVPNDLALASSEGLVLSGPNAGGKTVALKVLGLAALMARAGLPIPAAEGSRAGFFDAVLTDVGDEQSIEKNLSTFSAHVTNLARVLAEAGPASLVLLDEVATGTDPHEGAALACAVVEALLGAGCAVAVTTHYEALKALALEDPRLRNASVGFDVTRMEPTFHVRLDVPGSSSALAVAARFGMPSDVVAAAEARLSAESKSFDALARRLEAQYDALDAEREAAARERRAAEALRVQAEQSLEEARRRDRQKLGEEGEKLMADLRRARDELKEARRALRQRDQLDEAGLAAIRARVEGASGPIEEARAPLPPAPVEKGEPVAEAALSIGTRVWVPRLRTEVDVVEAPSRGRVRVAAGPVKLWVKVDEVRTRDAPRESEPIAKPVAAPARADRERPPTDANTLDVRGMRVDDALAMTESFLDRMFGREEPVAFILHGVGSGALRDAIREHLGAYVAQYVKGARPGTLEEGGERITAVYLR